MNASPNRPAYTANGLNDWLNAVPLPIPLPPGAEADWTCLFQLLGPRTCFARDGLEHAVSEEALRGLLEAAGRPTFSYESRALLLVTPLAGSLGSDPRALARLVRRAASTARGPEVLGVLRFRSDLVQELRALLLQLADPGNGTPHRRAAIDALGAGRWHRDSPEWTQVVTTLAQWDGELDAQRLLAMVRLGALPEELPMGELGPLHGWIPGLDVEAGRALLARLETLPEPLTGVLRAALAVVPGAAAALAEELVGCIARIPDHTAWLPVFAAAGEDVVEPLVDALAAEEPGSAGWKARMGAAMALGVLPDIGARALSCLRAAAMDDDSDVRREATLALRAHGENVPLDAWTDGYGFAQRVGPHHPWGAAFVGGPVPLDLVALLVRREGGALLAEAALALAFAHPDLSAPLLDALACDRGFDVPLAARIGAAAGVFSTGTVPATPVLHALLLGAVDAAPGAGGGAAIRRVAARAAATGHGSRDEGVAESLATLAARDGDWQVRLHALDLLDRLGDVKRFDSLLAVLESGDPDADVRALAASLRSPQFRTDTVAALLGDLVSARRNDTSTRLRALDGLLDRDEALAEPLASSLFRMEDRELAILAGRILGGLATDQSAPDRVSIGTQELRHPSWIRREAAGALLGALDPGLLDAGVFEELVETLDALSTTDDDTDVQRMARWASDTLRRRRS